MTLIERLEAASGAAFAFDAAIARACGYTSWPPPAYTASLDAALTLVPEGWVTTLTIYHDCSTVVLADDRVTPVRLPDIEVDANTPALALCIAALRARGIQ